MGVGGRTDVTERGADPRPVGRMGRPGSGMEVLSSLSFPALQELSAEVPLRLWASRASVTF